MSANDPFLDGNLPKLDDNQSWSFDLDDEALIPEGMHLVKISNVSEGQTQAGDSKLVFEFMVLSQEHLGQTLQLHIALTPKAMWRLQQVLSAVGISASSGKLSFKRGDVMERTLMVSVKHREFNGRVLPNVDQLSPNPNGVGAFWKNPGMPEIPSEEPPTSGKKSPASM